MMKLIGAFLVSFLLVQSCNIELQDQPSPECILHKDTKWRLEFNMPHHASLDTHLVVFERNRAAAHLIIEKRLITLAETLMTYSIIPADSASNLFFIADQYDKRSCAISVKKGDVIDPNYTRNSGLSDGGFTWCNDCEFVLYSRKTNEEESCGPAPSETWKVPYSFGSGGAANFGWFEFQATPNYIKFRSKSLGVGCSQLVIQ